MCKNELKPYLEFVKDLYDTLDPAHNFRHIQRITKRLNLLSEGIDSPLRLNLLYFLACFHGLWKKINSNDGFYKEVKEFLKDLEWSEAEICNSFESLERHLKNPLTIEERIVHDANYVELLGAFGIAKAFTTGGSRGQSYEESADIYEYEYLDKIKFQTEAGKKIAEEHRTYAKNFLKTLRNEL